MEDSATSLLRFETAPLELEAAFDGGRITSDGGLLWLAETDRDLGLCEAMAEHVPEWRTGRSVRHSLLALVRQRVYQVACGYEDQNDADTLRTDPLLKLVLGRLLPETDADLASQSTLSRLENAPGPRDCLRIARALVELYVRERGKDAAPEEIPSWTSTLPQIPPTASRKAPSTTATTARACITRSWSSMDRQTSSSRPS